MADARDRLRTTFNSAADRYQRARPEYPEPLYDALVGSAGLEPGDRLLEVGCASGKATLPLARRGFRVVGVDIGPDLAAAARHHLAGFPRVEIVESAFETWRPPGADPFDLVFAATAWHWIDLAIRYRRAWELLRPGGHLAFWSATHVFPDDGDPFFLEIQSVYDEIGEGLPGDATWPRPGDLPDDRREIERSGLFEYVVVRHVDREVGYGAEEYLRCSTRSPTTSPCRNPSASTSTPRSGGASHDVPAAASAATGARSCTSPAAPTSHGIRTAPPNPSRRSEQPSSHPFGHG